MSQKDESESDIWDYKPLEKKRKIKNNKSQSVTRRCTSRKTSKKDTSLSVKSHKESKTKESGESGADATACDEEEKGRPEATLLSPAKETVQRDSHDAAETPSEDHCPICQMPFFILVVQSQRWHVAECLETCRDKCEECPDGLQCSSTIPNHYKKFNHTLLAHTWANSNMDVFSLSQQAETSRGGCSVEATQGSSHSLSQLSTHSVPQPNTDAKTPPSKRPNSLLLLRSPAPEDFKKKKGWLSNKSQKSGAASQDKIENSSTPVKDNSESVAGKLSPTDEASVEADDEISYSPLSELPVETRASNECRKALFNNEVSDNESSVILFNDSFSSEDEVLAEFVDNNLEDCESALMDPSPSSSQLGSVSSLAPANHTAAEAQACCASTSKINHTSFQSPQRAVLERLRETLLCSEAQGGPDLNHNSSLTTPVSSSQSSSVRISPNMPPLKGHSKAGQASGYKQTDIGVFFGLKPLEDKKNETKSGPNDFDASSIPATGRNSGQKRQRRDQQRKNATADMSQTTETRTDVSSAGGEEAAGRGRQRGWRRRWNRGNPDGEAQLPRCPFYKKIPGTKFVVDAFHYGEIQGITAYFLTHFHSDHYGGLTKNSTLPVYCNKITGNLVKSKLRVAERYVHILPMNSEVNVDGVRVILLDANHCPGAAMLLFFLPDGQTVLHTGDFRADPSMESYPELLGCRVQTLYLDTTYCSPEYTFPTQQEVISFAASAAFELVTLNPRTLVVCGSYSVGKEKVFLALAEVLGSKVCLSRDKYNTMCCLESEQIKKRITTDWKAAQVHVLPMMQLSVKKLQDHLARFSTQYDQLVAFKPTGWTFSEQVESVGDIQPQISGNISIYGIPYSEHSSFLEMKRFVQWLRPLKIIPTVNVGSWSSRKAMERCFSDWLSESKARL
uniref:DNA cross-link repair 1A protein n=2 Tax=Iconisemion striatum TaxID=60296 RepID=A0A1A7XS70_9TELE